MQRFYVDTEGRCIGSHDGPPEHSPFAGTPVDSAPDDAAAQRWDGSAWHWSLEAIREKVLLSIAARYQRALSGGLTYGGKLLQIREQDQAILATMGTEARWAVASAVPWPTDFAWRMADDSFLAIPTAEDMIALAEAAKAEVYRLRQVKWRHIDAVRGMTLAAEIAAYDFETGW